jgi:hypothetical protein
MLVWQCPCNVWKEQAVRAADSASIDKKGDSSPLRGSISGPATL